VYFIKDGEFEITKRVHANVDPKVLKEAQSKGKTKQFLK
jgi:hypothetical protein